MGGFKDLRCRRVTEGLVHQYEALADEVWMRLGGFASTRIQYGRLGRQLLPPLVRPPGTYGIIDGSIG